MCDSIENLVQILGYRQEDLEQSVDAYYDYYYRLNLSDGLSCRIIGIKLFDTANEAEIRKYHRIYWNKNDLPISILVFKDDIRIYNNFTYNSKKALLYSSKEQKVQQFSLNDLSSESIHSNLFWERLYRIIKKTDRVDVQLLSNLEATINKISENSDCDKGNAFDFITKCILVKYLEDRKILVDSTFSKFESSDFTDLLSKKNRALLIGFFNHLRNKFNSDFFCIEANSVLGSHDALERIFDFFNGTDNETGQTSLFPYDFSIIPIELISSIYEKFFNIATAGSDKQRMRKETGSFYTPYFLADFMIDREIELTKENYAHIKILDPACGSGVFLVGAFKKIVGFYKQNNIRIDSDTLKNIILNQIFGVDKNLQALKITEFSLYIALLDCMDPKDLEINHFEFPVLIGRTLHSISFFSEEYPIPTEKFDIILGNPPWRGIAGDHVEYCQNRRYELSDKQLAQAFLYRANDFIKDAGSICFILPNSIFCNTNPIGFRRQILKINDIEELLNLSSISSHLFADANFPCSIVKCRKRTGRADIRFVNFTPNVFSNILNKIVFDFNNTASIDPALLEQHDYLWNIAMSGDYYDFLLIRNIKANHYTIADLCKDYNLAASQGYSKAKQSKKYDRYDGYRVLDDNIAHAHIFQSGLKTHYGILGAERIHDENQYKKHNKVIFRRTLKSDSATNYAAYYDDELLYNNKYYCIFDPENRAPQAVFLYLEAILNSKLYAYYQFHISTAFKINPPEIRLDKALAFPLPPYDGDSKTIREIIGNAREIHTLYEKLEDMYRGPLAGDTSATENEIADLLLKNEQHIFALYHLDDKDIETVNYTIDCRIPIVRNRSLSPATSADLEEYCGTIKRYFDALLEPLELKLVCAVYRSQTAVAVNFKFTADDAQPILFKAVKDRVLFYSVSDQLLVFKRIKQYYDNSFTIIKTADKYNWQNHNAFVDFQDFVKDSFVNGEAER